ncbi:uncharacterized protein CBL_09883 [Carabus blaptoides fortunei]
MITFSKVCRLCINKTHSDYTIQFVDEDSITLGDKIKIVCNIQINQSDCLPASICELCLDKIRQFYDFKLLCLHTSRQLSQLKKQFLISSSKTKKPQNISVQSIKDLSQNTNFIKNCITDEFKQVTSVQQQPSVQDESSQLVQSYPNDDHNAYTLPYDDRNVDIITSVPNNALKQVITKDSLVINGETMKVESKTNKKLAHVKLEMNVKKVEDKWMNWVNPQQSKVVESAKAVDSSVEDTNDHIANEEDTEAKDNEIDDLMEYDSYLCDICSKHFTNKFSFLRHQRYHVQHETNYQCDRCGHKRIHSRDPNEIKPCNFTCEICGKMVRTKDSLMKHAGVHSDERPFKCELCGKCFKYKSCCNAHRRIYHEGKTVECTVCDPSALRSHTIAHSNIKQHKCEYCSHEFKHKNHMMIHIKKKHSDLMTKTNNISKESAANEKEQSESMMVDNEEETIGITMTENELIPEIIIEEQACEIIIAET